MNELTKNKLEIYKNNKLEIYKNNRIKFAKSYFISIFNEKRLIARKQGESDVIMTDYDYFIISDCYDEIHNKFIKKNYKWKHIHELGYIVISWNRYFVLR